MRALARGDTPETVIQRIADFRAADKPDPVYYARLTVTKAQANLEKPTTSARNHDRTSSERSSRGMS